MRLIDFGIFVTPQNARPIARPRRSSALAIRASPQSKRPRRLSRLCRFQMTRMKGRIIAAKGGISARSSLNGVDVIIDDTPDTVVVSCFDPVRREWSHGCHSRSSLRTDGFSGQNRRGRGQVAAGSPTRRSSTPESGRRTERSSRPHPELIKLIGRMRWRTSYGQNILSHSQEVRGWRE